MRYSMLLEDGTNKADQIGTAILKSIQQTLEGVRDVIFFFFSTQLGLLFVFSFI